MNSGLHSKFSRKQFLHSAGLALSAAAPRGSLPLGPAAAGSTAEQRATTVLQGESVMNQANNAALQRLLDDAEIIRIVNDIDNRADSKDWETCRSYFMDDVDVDFTSLAGGEPARMKADDLIHSWQTGLYEDKQSLHMRTNHQVTTNGNQAEVFSHGYAYNQLAIGNGSDLWEVWGTYEHTLQRTPQGWKVTSFKFFATYARGNERVREYVP